RRVGNLDDTAHEIAALGRRVIPVACDVSDVGQIEHMYVRLDREFGRIDVLAAIPGENVLRHPEEIEVDEFVSTLQSTLVGKFYCCQQAGRRMLRAGKGSIIVMSSIGGVLALGRGNFAYSVGQSGAIQMVREMSTEWAGRGVRVNAIAPAQITNEGLERRMAEDPDLKAAFLHGIPMGRLGRPEEIKGIVIFLASDASSFVTGAVIPMDGGNLAMNAGGTHY
ncbi:MAG: SDR family oxidoreductase, partial [Anaerolineae bacterium]|nr:SDR family oxidoreductase [Anaerolineae bacterium]